MDTHDKTPAVPAPSKEPLPSPGNVVLKDKTVVPLPPEFNMRKPDWSIVDRLEHEHAAKKAPAPAVPGVPLASPTPAPPVPGAAPAPQPLQPAPVKDKPFGS